ncbi:MAG TPA: hypothetical protein VGG29_03470 [Caulobacteraceae bacterium]|jgi:hypothetical protein
MSDRERIARIVRGLRARTTERGCTEAEALDAAAKLAQLLEAHNMSVDEAELRASPFERHTERHRDEVGGLLWKPASAIAELTGARYWTTDGPGGATSIDFFGFSHEVDVARYLLEICAGAMRRERDAMNRGLMLLAPAFRLRQLLPFLDGMADRLRTRILALKPKQPAGQGLILVRNSLIDAAMPVKVERGHAGGSLASLDSYRDGLAAGDAVALNPGLGGRAAQEAIGGRS